MATTVEMPDRDATCAYCDSPIFAHDPICVRDCTTDCGSPAYFSHYACLAVSIDENRLTDGDACAWSPE